MSRFNPHAFAARRTSPSPTPTTGSSAAPTLAALPDPAPVNAVSPVLTHFIATYGRPGANQVVIPDGMVAVTITLRFNDSAIQVDYFNHHASTGCPEFLLLLAKKQAQTENLARKALSLCPELQSLDWKWHTERYAGGHGNYFASSPITLPETIQQNLTVRKTWGNEPITEAFWEIEFVSAWRGRGVSLWPHKHYGAKPVTGLVEPSIAANLPPPTVKWCLNDALRGVEIHFSHRPEDKLLNPLRAAREWRYSGHSKCWYARQSPENIAFAQKFCEEFGQTPSTAPVAVPLPAPALVSPVREIKIIRFPGIADLMRPRVGSPSSQLPTPIS